MNLALLWNSLLFSAATALAAVLAGFAVALAIAGCRPALQRPLLACCVGALMVPPFLAVNCWIFLLGHSGILRPWLPINVYSLTGVVWVLTLLFWPFTTLLTTAALRRLDPALVDAEPALRGVSFVRWLLWPLARGAVGLAALLTFVLALNSFAVPAILQVRVFPAEVWVRFNTHLNATEALLLSWPLLLVPLVLLPFLARSSVHWPAPTRLTTAESLRRQLGLPLMITCGLLAAVLLLLSLGLPLGQLLLEARTWEQLPEAWLATAPVAWNTFVLGAVTATCCLALGLLTWHLRVGLALWVAFLLPGVFVGIALIHLLNRPWTQALYQSLAIIILAWTCRFVALAWHAVRGGANRLDPALIDAARMDGAGTWLVFRHAWWPQIGPQLCGAWYLIFLLCLWDAETLLLVYPPGGETIALRIFNLLHYGHTGQVNALILLLIVLALLPLLALVVPRLKRLALPLTALLLLTGCSRSADFDSRIFSGVEIIGERGTALGQFNKPRSVALDLHDNLFVVDMTGRVQKFGPDGKFISSWQMQQTELGKPKGMCRDAAGRIVVLEPHYSRVNHYEPNGKLVQQWGTHGTNTGQLALPRAVACTPDGRIYVSEYGMTERVQCFSAPGGALTQVIGRAGSGPGQFNRPEGLGVDSAGGLYVADSCNHRIQVLGPDGAFIRAYGRPGQAPTEMSYPYDVRVDPAGLQFVCEFGNSRIQVFDARDQVQEILGGPGSAPGRFHNPWSIALDSRGNLYVADSGNHRVQKFVRRQPLPSKT